MLNTLVRAARRYQNFRIICCFVFCIFIAEQWWLKVCGRYTEENAWYFAMQRTLATPIPSNPIITDEMHMQIAVAAVWNDDSFSCENMQRNCAICIRYYISAVSNCQQHQNVTCVTQVHRTTWVDCKSAEEGIQIMLILALVLCAIGSALAVSNMNWFDSNCIEYWEKHWFFVFCMNSQALDVPEHLEAPIKILHEVCQKQSGVAEGNISLDS